MGLGPDRAYAIYDNFKIAPVKQKFKLTIGKYSGTAGGPHAERSVQNTTKDSRRQEVGLWFSLTWKKLQRTGEGNDKGCSWGSEGSNSWHHPRHPARCQKSSSTATVDRNMSILDMSYWQLLYTEVCTWNKKQSSRGLWRQTGTQQVRRCVYTPRRVLKKRHILTLDAFHYISSTREITQLKQVSSTAWIHILEKLSNKFHYSETPNKKNHLRHAVTENQVTLWCNTMVKTK